MKKTKLLMLSLCFISYNALSGGVPVFDGAASIRALNEWQEKLQQWQSTNSFHNSNLTLGQAQLGTLSGVKDQVKNFNVKTLVKDISSIDKIMPNYDSIVSGKFSKESNALASKLDLNGRCVNNHKELVNLCKSENLNLAANYIAMEKVNEQINVISEKIGKLADEVSQSDTVKNSTDINNEITVFNNQLELLDRKLELTQKQFQSNQMLIDKQKEKIRKELNLRPSTEAFQRLENELKRKNKNIVSFDGF
ncbi:MULTISPECIES: type IV secretion system protein [unclassified Gilliamella]|uniref:type IV secretion system protein n=1 Tax=unclassified Gilliamella TaxID=2685620 RepID=UPI00226A2849|nr:MULTISPECIES: type IV secretion system protein [unclassified Gilliamella]MCX8573825.1 hypothetical protein [Gilliamella sp. B3831]MCX8576055.1 hypothetical protein [Gilliamella sp. B3815]MCX8590565.1 hypothetical protein [Gilliamella sp. B3812]MCX8603157.1 hypothetical protein [Gilliamella sp. B3823]MCX8605280.1 hypothetical protein [Gilliamella sp. B3825]